MSASVLSDHIDSVPDDVSTVSTEYDATETTIDGTLPHISSKSDRMYILAKHLLEIGYWNTLLPRHERNLLSTILSNHRSWITFLNMSGSPSSMFHGQRTSNALASSSQSLSTPRRAKPTKSARSKRVTTPRRRGNEPEPESSESQHAITSHDLLETLHTRIRTFLFDALVDEVAFPNDKYLQAIPLNDSIAEGTNFKIIYIFI